MTATATLIGLFGLGLVAAALALGEAVHDRRNRYGTRQRRTAPASTTAALLITTHLDERKRPMTTITETPRGRQGPHGGGS